jgi:cell division FtsZ-interacting protein ZapD
MEHASTTVMDKNNDGLAARLLQACSDLLEHAISCLNDAVTKSQLKSLTRVRQLLVIWSDRHDVEDGALDATLQKSKSLMALVVSALGALLKTLFEGTLRRPL